MNVEAASIVARLGLEPLPLEGGFFRRTWTSDERLPTGRAAGTAIYFLATDSDFSALHRLRTDEAWCHHSGDPVEHVQLVAGETAPRLTLLGCDPASGQVPQLIVPAGVWQGAHLAPTRAHGWSLMTCFMAPGWDDREFELGARTALRREFPGAAAWIDALTR